MNDMKFCRIDIRDLCTSQREKPEDCKHFKVCKCSCKKLYKKSQSVKELESENKRLKKENEELRNCHEAELGVCYQYCDKIIKLKKELQNRKDNFDLDKGVQLLRTAEVLEDVDDEVAKAVLDSMKGYKVSAMQLMENMQKVVDAHKARLDRLEEWFESKEIMRKTGWLKPIHITDIRKKRQELEKEGSK